jgi:hypothetical protein
LIIAAQNVNPEVKPHPMKITRRLSKGGKVANQHPINPVATNEPAMR